MISYSIKPTKIFTIPMHNGVPDVIAQFDWAITFTDGLTQSIAGGTTRVPLAPEGEPTISATALQPEDYIAMVQQEIGDEWNTLFAFHEKLITDKSRLLQYNVFYDTKSISNPTTNEIIEI